MVDVLIRASRPGDGEAYARLWRDVGSFFASINPHTFQVPAAEGLAEWFEEMGAVSRDAEDRVSLVAEVDGVLVGALSATLHEPLDNAERQVQTDFARWRVHVDSLGVMSTHRGCGVGSALMRAVEEWGRERGAEVILLETEANNPLSVPFYERRMGFSVQALEFRKEIGRS